MIYRIAICALACLGMLAQTSSGQETATQPGNQPAQGKGMQANRLQILPSVQAFLETLDAPQRELAMLEYDSDERVNWHFIPKPTRQGLPLMQMQAQQKQAAMKLLRATVSKIGYEKASTIMQLKTVLKQLEAGKGQNERNPEKYYFTVFGKPAAQQHWGLRIEGHHLSLNFVLQGNRIVDSTPQFFASNPAELKESYGEKFPKGMQVLGTEEQLAFELVNDLSEAQLAMVMLPGATPSEIRGAGEPQPPTDELGGISASQLNEGQAALLKRLMESYTNKMKPMVAKSRWELIEKAGFEKIKFGWSGANKPGIGHYYVVQGPSFVIEFINVQPDAAGNPANHIHCVWRDMQGDFDLPIK